MAKFKDDEGNEVDVITPEEVEAQLKAKEEELKKEYEEKITQKDNEMAEVNKAKAELEEKLNKADPQSQNFKTLKAALDAKDAKLNELAETIKKDKTERVGNFTNSLIKAVAKGNEELEKKIKLNFEQTLAGVKGDTEEEIQKKVESAVKLSMDAGAPNPLDMAMQGAGGRGMGAGAGSGSGAVGVEFTAREKALGAKMGISEEDYKKYASRVSKDK